MGLFDSVYGADPRTQGLLAAGAAMMGGPSRLPVSLGQSIGQGYMAGNQAYQQAMQLEAQRKQQEEQAKLRELQLQEFKAKADELARQREEADWMRNTAAQFAKAGPDGQTTFDSEGFLNVLATRNPLQAADLRKKMIPERKTSVVGSGATLVDDKGTPIFTAPEKPEKAPAKPSAIQEYEYAVGQGYKGTFDQWDTNRKKAGATSVSVNTGQKGFDNTLKLRSDFRSEPIYKAHQEVQSAYQQIKQGLDMASPAGDLAGATKIMKLLDPTSVVRESELAMAMAATGALDRLSNYAQNVINGTKLTPSQRADFRKLADQLLTESAKQYNLKRKEYAGISDRNELNTQDVVGPEASLPSMAPPPTAPLTATDPKTGKRVIFKDGKWQPM